MYRTKQTLNTPHRYALPPLRRILLFVRTALEVWIHRNDRVPQKCTAQRGLENVQVWFQNRRQRLKDTHDDLHMFVTHYGDVRTGDEEALGKVRRCTKNAPEVLLLGGNYRKG